MEDDGRLKSLTPKEHRRYTEIVVQGSLRSDGPSVLFRYRPVIDVLSLSADQERQILNVLWQDTRGYREIPRANFAESLPQLDKQTSRDIDAILTDKQREIITKFLGSPADEYSAGPDEGAATPAASPANSSPRNPLETQRLVYPVNHASAHDLALDVKEHFQKTGDVEAVADPTGRVVLATAPAPRIEEVRAALRQLDRPRRSVIVAVIISEEPRIRTDPAAVDAEKHRPGDKGRAELLAQITRLETGSRGKKLLPHCGRFG